MIWYSPELDIIVHLHLGNVQNHFTPEGEMVTDFNYKWETDMQLSEEIVESVTWVILGHL